MARVAKRDDPERFLYTTQVIGGDENRWICHYCGQPGGTVDHIPPVSRFHDAVASSEDFRPIKVPACMECNALAGAELHTSFLDRRAFVKHMLAKRYRRQLAVVMWTSAELRGMSRSFRASIVHDMKARAFVEGRISFLIGVS